MTNFESPAFNIVGVIEGTDPVLKKEFVVLSAHYDHIGIEKKIRLIKLIMAQTMMLRGNFCCSNGEVF